MSINNLRIKWASFFGRKEHFFGRAIAFPIVASLAYNYFYIKDMIGFYISCAIFLCWIVYLVSHTLEKALYPHNFR